MDLFERFRARFPFPLDGFQVEACRAIAAGSSVIVSAPTGAGKTLVAEFAIQAALETGKRIAYTTPLKALSNQKYGDFVRAWSGDDVGILTGDVKVNPRGRLLVMTTEILRNMFYAGGLDELGYVVLDECHYMGDEGRGTVWEEIIVNTPKDVLLVALSATVANVVEIADWISLVHRPILPIYHPERPVPLSYHLADLAGEIHPIDKVRSGRARVIGDEPRGPDDRGRWYTRRVVDSNVMIDALETRGWLPAIYFIFSRAGCERAMDDVLTGGRALLGREQQREVDVAIGEAMAESPSMGDSEINQAVFRALRLGVAVHHAGILPSLKRLIERLFERGLCKVVFATETMSLGIHMPARSVVLQGLTKRTEHGFRLLSHNELTQMAGRAGRRGIDAEGQCVIALDARDGVEDVLRVVDGAPEPIASRFKLGYGSVAMLLATGAPPEALRRRIEASFGQYQNLKRVKEMESEIARLEARLAEVRGHPAPCGDFSRIGRYRRLRQEADARRRALGRGNGRGERGLVGAEPGRLALVKRRGAPSLAVVLGIHGIRGHRALVDALLPHGAVVRLKAGAIKQLFWSTPPLHVPRDRARDPRGLRHVADQLARLDAAELLERERAQRPEAALGTVECHRCPWGATRDCDQAWREVERVEERLAMRRQALEAARGAYWQEFLRVVEVLEQFGAVRDRQLEAKGRLIAGFRHDNELLVAEVVTRGLLSDLTLAEAAAVCSALTEEARSGEPNLARVFLKKRPKLRQKLHQLEDVAGSVGEAQRARHLGMAVSVHPGFMPAVFRWASGEDDWTAIVQESFGGHEGDLIRAMRRLLDLLRQLAESPEVPPTTARLLHHAARVIDRGIVLESALI
ncbi:MAG: DEAD/DEAH box helicase [Candidatus Rokubacteria bacterium]|nr:DEAD/DEAH box helicase [Candidatus Rokubacteria bacterium]MBI3827806.1 DEAD/DEAH box helicase [Candidatus Rokubacteria bacterium]